jgi:hypothetical protein
MDDNQSKSSLVVIEAGAGWPAWITDYQRSAPNAAVVAQASSDCVEAFSSRVLHRLAEIERSPLTLNVAVVVCSDMGMSLQSDTRRAICRAIAAVLSARGDLVLAAIEDTTPAFKQELFELAGELCEEFAHQHVNVRVRFSKAKSGMMPSVFPNVVGERIEEEERDYAEG